jgi:hypothetical protein
MTSRSCSQAKGTFN